MRWTPGQTSGDIEDRRDQGGEEEASVAYAWDWAGGLLILGLLSLIFKQNFFALFSGGVPRLRAQRW